MTKDRNNKSDIELPPPPLPMGAYIAAQRTGPLVYVSGQLPRWGDEMRYSGKPGLDVSMEDAREAARLAALNALAVLQHEIGDLAKVVKIVKMTGSVASPPGFTDQPQIVNAASDVLVEVLGERGRHARMAVGVAELPANAPVAIELIAEIED